MHWAHPIEISGKALEMRRQNWLSERYQPLRSAPPMWRRAMEFRWPRRRQLLHRPSALVWGVDHKPHVPAQSEELDGGFGQAVDRFRRQELEQRRIPKSLESALRSAILPAALGPTTAVTAGLSRTLSGSGPKQRKPERVTLRRKGRAFDGRRQDVARGSVPSLRMAR